MLLRIQVCGQLHGTVLWPAIGLPGWPHKELVLVIPAQRLQMAAILRMFHLGAVLQPHREV
jgi:hypothetical protein